MPSCCVLYTVVADIGRKGCLDARKGLWGTKSFQLRTAEISTKEEFIAILTPKLTPAPLALYRFSSSTATTTQCHPVYTNEHGAISRRWVCHYASVSLQTAMRYGGGMKMWLFQVPVLYAHTWHMPLFSSTTAVAPNLNVYNAFIHIYSTDLALYCWCKISYLCVF